LKIIGDILPLACMHAVNSSRPREFGCMQAPTQFGSPGCYGECGDIMELIIAPWVIY